VPESDLLNFPGPIASSDTHLIDARPEVIDLSGEVIRQVAKKGRQFLIITLTAAASSRKKA
jgi:hypothetical protein